MQSSLIGSILAQRRQRITIKPNLGDRLPGKLLLVNEDHSLLLQAGKQRAKLMTIGPFDEMRLIV